MRRIFHIFFIFFIFPFLTAYANDSKFLSSDEAFQVQTKIISSNEFQIQWKIAKGYHLYSDTISVTIVSPENTALKPLALPQGKVREYYNQLMIPVQLEKGSTHGLSIKVSYQGCSDNGLCYPPQTKTLKLSSISINNHFKQLVQESDSVHSINHLFENQNPALVLLSFFAFGLLLALTPCVFPMLPILSSLLAGQDAERMSTMHAFLLSFVYVLASAITYAIIGIFAGLAGHHIQIFLQNTLVLILSGVVFLLLSMSLFGLYELQVPHWLQSKLSHLSHRKKHGPLINAALMGIFSTLIVSPCVSAPLVGALAYIGGTGNPWLGAGALFVMGMGMGAPLLVIGTSAGKFLPKAGRWMVSIKNFFGIVLVGMAIWLWSRVLPAPFIMALWGVLAIGCGIYLGALDRTEMGWARFFKVIGIILGIYGLSLLIGALSGSSNLFLPLENLFLERNINHEPMANLSTSFKKITSLEELDIELQHHQPVLLDFYADWCENCKIMKRKVFDAPEVQSTFSEYHLQLLQVDMTKSTPEIRAILKKYHVVAPPTILFFDLNGKWQEDATLVGLQTPDMLLSVLDHLQSSSNS